MVHRAKDELEIATNWQRVFIDIYQQLKWLNSFATINELAVKKILKKFIKEHFELKDNVLNNFVNMDLEQMQFSKKKSLHFAIDDMLQFIATHFTRSGLRNEARKLLETHNAQVRRSDALIITFFSACSITMALIGAFFLFSPPSDRTHNELYYIYNSTSVLRVTFFFIYLIFATGFCIQVFVIYGVNYLYIFELDPQAKMTHHQLYKVGTIFLFIWSTCFALSLIEIRLNYLFFHQPMWLMLALSIFFLLYCLQPCFGCGYRRARFQVVVSIWEILISPFGRVRFRDFFMADVITSMAEPLKDIANSVFYLYYI